MELSFDPWKSDEPTPSERRRKLAAAASVVLHALFVLLLVNAPAPPPVPVQEIATPRIQFSFEDPPVLKVPGVPPNPQEKPNTNAIRPADPAPEASQPPRRPDNSDLLGWNAPGTKKGNPERAPGPELRPEEAPPAGGALEAAEGGPLARPEAERQPERGQVAVPRESDPPGSEASENEPAPARMTASGEVASDQKEGIGVPPLKLPEAAGKRPRLALPEVRAVDRGQGARSGPLRGEGEGLGDAPKLDFQQRGGSLEDLQFDSRDFNWSDYTTKMIFALERQLARELDARWRRIERDLLKLNRPIRRADALLRCTLHRDGSVSDVSVLEPSLVPSITESCAATLSNAVLPRLPDDFPRDREGVTLRCIVGW